MDSREYIFIYALKTNSDIPPEYRQSFPDLRFEAGVFLPQDDSQWFTRPPKYPARLLLLRERSIYIVPHPSSDHPPIEIRLDNLIQFESGSALLRGWLRFTTGYSTQEIIYNTRASRPLEEFLVKVKRRWLGDVQQVTATVDRAYGSDLDIKFRNSVYSELDYDELVILQYFQAPVRDDKRFLLFKREHWRPGNVLLVTSKNRLIWITDRCGTRRELYASRSFSVPLQFLRRCSMERDTEEQLWIVFEFGSNLNWRIPGFVESDKDAEFCQQMNQVSINLGEYHHHSVTSDH